MAADLGFPPNFITDYESYVETVLKPARALVHPIVHEEWRADGYWERYRQNLGTVVPRPIQRVRSRIKRPESLLDKFERLADQFPEGPTIDNFSEMIDFLGFRVVTYFLSQLKIIDDELRTGSDFEIRQTEKPRAYIASSTLARIGIDPINFELTEPKWSGYASIHYTLRLASPDSGSEANPWFELQVRTVVEEAWAEIHHQLGYKPSQQTHFSVERQFRVIASHLTAVDDHFDFLYDRLIYLQSVSDPVAEDSINAENFPRVLDAYSVAVQQGEIDTLLKILGIHGIKTVSQFQRLARPEIVDAIGSEYKRASGVRLNAFHLVATLVYLRTRSTPDEARTVVRYHLALVDLLRRTRQGEGRQVEERDSPEGD